MWRNVGVVKEEIQAIQLAFYLRFWTTKEMQPREVEAGCISRVRG